MRVFVAIDLPDAVRDVLEDLQEHLPVGRLMDPETFHLTLAFLDEQPRETVVTVHEALDALRAEPVTVQLQGLGTFGSKSPMVLWAGVAPNPGLSRLRGKVRSAVRLAGIDLPRERFRPHVTLARFGARVEGAALEKLRLFLDRFGAAPMPQFTASRITLFSSHLRADGARHDSLAEYDLSGKNRPA